MPATDTQAMTPHSALRLLERELGKDLSADAESALERLWSLVLTGK